MAKITITNQAAPSTPATGTSEVYVDSTTKALTTIDDTGTVRSATTYAHPNHTGEVTSTGDGATVMASTYISNKGEVTAAVGDHVPIIDATDGSLKKATLQTVIDLGVSDHTGLSNIGTNTHAQIDTFIANHNTTPVLTNPTTLNTTNVDINNLMYYRDGRFMIGEGLITWNGAGAGGTWSVTIPDSKVIDTNYLAGGTGVGSYNSSRVGDCTFYNNGTSTFSGPTYPLTTTTLQFFTSIALPGSIFANLDGLRYTFKLPIVGWS